jgi:two-component system, NarL family, response regulator LiaR
MTDATRLRLLIAEDHTLVREGTRRILEQQSDFEVVGEAESGEAAIDLAASLRPDVAILDVRLPGCTGIDACREIAARQLGVRCLILSAYDDEQYVIEALRAGASGYLLKTAPSRELVDAVRAVGSGATVLQDAISRRLAESRIRPAQGGAAGEVSARELDVLRLAARGLANKDIARRLGISRRTVEGHMNNLFSKLGATSRTEVVLEALNRHLVEMEAR